MTCRRSQSRIRTVSLVQVAFITGQSRPPSCALSPVQTAFIDRLAASTGAHAVHANYPYQANANTWRRTSLSAASVRNAWQFLRARSNRSRQVQHAFLIRSLLAQADHTVFLAGSCGLELLASLGLSAATLAPCSYVAYGPVARSLPACDGLVVRGRRDWISRVWPVLVHREIACGHLDYLEKREFFDICSDFVHAQRRRILGRTHAAAF